MNGVCSCTMQLGEEAKEGFTQLGECHDAYDLATYHGLLATSSILSACMPHD